MSGTLLITGGTGFLGRYIIDMLDKDFPDLPYSTVRLMVRSPEKASDITLNNYEVETVKGDLFDTNSLVNAVDRIDAMIHVAAIYDTSSSREEFYKANVEGTRVLLESMMGDTRVVLTSTYGVYGLDTPKRPITEDYEPKKPFWHYQTSKKAQEDTAFEISEEKGLDLTAIRPATIIGPKEYFFIPNAVESIRNNNVAILSDNGENRLPFIHAEDAAKAHLLALQQMDTASGKAYHVSGFEPQFKELVNYISREIGEGEVTRKIPYRLAYSLGWIADKTPIPLPLSRFEVKFLASHCELDTSRIEEDLGWEAEYGMETTLDQTLEWYKEEQPEPRA
ncbi:MAG: NAD(P)-dependent oxidoreductase [Halobacteria archaeon]|nr:NAD(P)-dependent oxidoreductase [Halobacteria archaeon]